MWPVWPGRLVFPCHSRWWQRRGSREPHFRSESRPWRNFRLVLSETRTDDSWQILAALHVRTSNLYRLYRAVLRHEPVCTKGQKHSKSSSWKFRHVSTKTSRSSSELNATCPIGSSAWHSKSNFQVMEVFSLALRCVDEHRELDSNSATGLVMLFPDLPWLAGMFMTANRIQTATHPKESSISSICGWHELSLLNLLIFIIYIYIPVICWWHFRHSPISSPGS